MRKIIAIFILIVFFTAPVVAIAAEDINNQILDLRRQIDDLNKQAEQYKNNINKKQKEGNTLKKQIDLLNNQVLRLEAQINSTGKEIDTSRLQISSLQGQIFDAERQMKAQKASIGRLLSIIQQADHKSLLALLIQNPRLSEFTNQAQQINDVTDKLSESILQLKSTKDALETNEQLLQGKKNDLESLNKRQISQKSGLAISKDNKDELLQKTKGEEKLFQQLLSEAEQKEADFFNQLKTLESQALKDGAFIVHVTASSVPPKGSKILRWPEDDYYLTQGYGYTKYAKRGAYGGAPHNGVDLSSGAGTAIHPVMGGAILASGFNDGFGNWVAVRHTGDIVSVYGHMNRPSGLLTNGTSVDASSVIGYEGTTGNSTGSHVHLSVYKDFFTYLKKDQLYFNYFEGTLNPLDYLP